MINSAVRRQQRYRRERVFKFLGLAGISSALLFLVILMTLIIVQGWRTFLTADIRVTVQLDASLIGASGEESALKYNTLLKQSLRRQFPQADSRKQKKELYGLLSFSAALVLREQVLNTPSAIGSEINIWLPSSSLAERYLKGGTDIAQAEERRDISDYQISLLDDLRQQGATDVRFNTAFFTSADSRDAEVAGIGGALLGSLFSLTLAFLLSFPVGVLAAVYLELFAPRNRWFDFIEININNLAAVPSVIFGLLGLAIFINFFGLPRSSSLVGGMVLSLMILPTIIIATRASLAGVPPSLLAGALSLGATKMQGVFHHVLPNAMPGILTGTIIGMAQALGETAPLLIIGMVAFIVELPQGITEAATALPVQIFLWSDSPERGFVERTSAAIIVLLFFLVVMNAAAIYIRHKLEKKW